MSRAIWKWRLKMPGDSLIIDVPTAHCFVHAGLDGGDFSSGVSDNRPMPAVWAMVDPAAETVQVKLRCVVTGQEWDNEKWHYLFTFSFKGLFFHLLKEACE